MKDSIKTSIEFTKNILTTGAFKETSRKVELEISSRLPKAPNQVIVEFGLGHGNITREVLNNIDANSRLYAFEVKTEFCDYVASHIDDERLVIINDGAENLQKHISEPVHGFVSSIPFTFFSKEMSHQILESASEALEQGCYFSQILYSRFHKKKFADVFDEVSIKRLVNIPMEYVYHCRKLNA